MKFTWAAVQCFYQNILDLWSYHNFPAYFLDIVMALGEFIFYIIYIQAVQPYIRTSALNFSRLSYQIVLSTL